VHTFLRGKRCGLVGLTFGHRVPFSGLGAHRLHTAGTLTQLPSAPDFVLIQAGLAMVGVPGGKCDSSTLRCMPEVAPSKGGWFAAFTSGIVSEIIRIVPHAPPIQRRMLACLAMADVEARCTNSTRLAI
jgi:hypothetical protein